MKTGSAEGLVVIGVTPFVHPKKGCAGMFLLETGKPNVEVDPRRYSRSGASIASARSRTAMASTRAVMASAFARRRVLRGKDQRPVLMGDR